MECILPFTKMQGAGNDYIYLDRMDPLAPPMPISPSELARRMSPRHTSVGADGLVLILPSEVADARMRMFNADGSEGMMCGNAIRCVGKYLYDRAYCLKTDPTIETASGIKHLKLHPDAQGKIASVTVDMGVASWAPEDIPLSLSVPLRDTPLSVEGMTYRITALSVGNPHCVIFTEDILSIDPAEPGRALEQHPFFPEGVNVEFVQLINDHTLQMRVWERGSGETYD